MSSIILPCEHGDLGQRVQSLPNHGIDPSHPRGYLLKVGLLGLPTNKATKAVIALHRVFEHFCTQSVSHAKGRLDCLCTAVVLRRRSCRNLSWYFGYGATRTYATLGVHPRSRDTFGVSKRTNTRRWWYPCQTEKLRIITTTGHMAPRPGVVGVHTNAGTTTIIYLVRLFQWSLATRCVALRTFLLPCLKDIPPSVSPQQTRT